ncbi:olfactory receptor 52K1-like [Perca flavescens]|uniref:olfactory receptor 52K1-like n=1 Tax=Perca flavescens TaxID=8167 RepID=UPI00106E44ED|nr:olfactory receptor 52K1-like [Perca flavescens]
MSLDDILAHGSSFQTASETLRLVLQRVSVAGLKLHPQKCRFMRKEVEFMGHRLGGRRHQHTAAPLYHLLQKGRGFTWMPHCQQAFNYLQKALTEALIGCLVQMFFIHSIGAFQSTLLVWMALDRYFAICTPLYYHERMALTRFLKFIIPLVLRNVFMDSLLVSLAGKLSFCRNVMNHCFCEHMALVELACGSTAINNLVGLMTVVLIPLVDFIIITASYIIIFSSVPKSGGSGVKALQTCVTHIVVIIVSLTIALVAFLSYRIRNGLPAESRVFFSTMYVLFPNCFNPITYGIRTAKIRQNKSVK